MQLKSGQENIKEHKYCMRCGRKLISVESRIRGYGSVCEKKLQNSQRIRLFTSN